MTTITKESLDAAHVLAEILGERSVTMHVHSLSLREALGIAAKLGDAHPRIKHFGGEHEFYSLDVTVPGHPVLRLSLFVDRPDTPFGPGRPEGDDDGDDPGARPLDGSA